MKHEAGWSGWSMLEINGKIRIGVSQYMEKDQMLGNYDTSILPVDDKDGVATFLVKLTRQEVGPENYIDINGDC